MAALCENILVGAVSPGSAAAAASCSLQTPRSGSLVVGESPSAPSGEKFGCGVASSTNDTGCCIFLILALDRTPIYIV